MKRFLIIWSACAAYVGAASAQLQMLSPDGGSSGAAVSSLLGTSDLTQQVMNDLTFTRTLSGAVKDGLGVRVSFETVGPPRMPHKLAQAYPTVEKYHALPHNDLAGAVAIFLIGSYQGAHAVEVEDDDVKVLGMFMVGVQSALKQAPNPQIAANMKKSAEGYLRTFLGVDPSRVSIGKRGLTLEVPPGQPASPRAASRRPAIIGVCPVAAIWRRRLQQRDHRRAGA